MINRHDGEFYRLEQFCPQEKIYDLVIMFFYEFYHEKSYIQKKVLIPNGDPLQTEVKMIDVFIRYFADNIVNLIGRLKNYDTFTKFEEKIVDYDYYNTPITLHDTKDMLSMLTFTIIRTLTELKPVEPVFKKIYNPLRMEIQAEVLSAIILSIHENIFVIHEDKGYHTLF